MTLFLWVAAEFAAIATDLAEFLGAAIGFYLLVGPALLAHGWQRSSILMLSALVTGVLVFLILALELYGFRKLEFGIMTFVFGLCFTVWFALDTWRPK